MIDQLVEKIKKTKAPVVVGLDPMLSYIPEWILKDAISKYGRPWRRPEKRFGYITKESWMRFMI